MLTFEETSLKPKFMSVLKAFVFFPICDKLYTISLHIFEKREDHGNKIE